jgi:uncharacterized membrane protein
MNNLSYLKIISFLIGIIFLFINWKIGIVILSLAYFFFYVFMYGPNYTLSVLSGLSIFSAIVFIFINWKITIILLIVSYILIKFRLHGNKINFQNKLISKK